MTALGLFNYWAVIFLMMVGFYTLIARGNLVKKIIGLNIFQTSVFILYITMGKITGGTAPIFVESGEDVIYSNSDSSRIDTYRDCGRRRDERSRS